MKFKKIKLPVLFVVLVIVVVVFDKVHYYAKEQVEIAQGSFIPIEIHYSTDRVYLDLRHGYQIGGGESLWQVTIYFNEQTIYWEGKLPPKLLTLNKDGIPLLVVHQGADKIMVYKYENMWQPVSVSEVPRTKAIQNIFYSEPFYENYREIGEKNKQILNILDVSSEQFVSSFTGFLWYKLECAGHSYEEPIQKCLQNYKKSYFSRGEGRAEGSGG